MALSRVLCVFIILIFASVSSGQTLPSLETSVGYSLLRERPAFDRQGWVTSITANVKPWFGVKGEISGNYTDTAHHDVHSFLGGAQFTLRRNSAFVPWGQVLFGPARTGNGATLTNFQEVITLHALPIVMPSTRTDFAFQPGGGIDIWFRRSVGVRVGADYRMRLGTAFVDRDSFRLQLGLVLRTGSANGTSPKLSATP